MFERPPSPQPRFSIVAAVYNVSPYLDEFFSSLERQTYGIENLDILLVDDGSTDDSRELCEAFAAKWPSVVRVFHKENGGQATARNLGLESVRGEWVCFVDPDDALADDYFNKVSSFLAKNPDSGLHMLTTPFIFWDEATGRKTTSHALHFKYSKGDRVINLRAEPENIQLGSNTAFFRMELINRIGLRFDSRVRPTFEDAHFVARYLVESEAPVVGLIASAKYFYRKRADKSSSVDTSYAQPGKYTDVPKYGYIDALKYAHSKLGYVPIWLQYTVLYDLTWSFRNDAAVHSAAGGISPEVQARFHELVGETLQYISSDALKSFSVIGMPDDVRFAFSHGYTKTPEAPVAVRLSRFDLPRGIVAIRYRFAGNTPQEDIYVDSQLVAPTFEKNRSIVFFGRTLAMERTIWIPVGHQMRLFLDGIPASFGPEVQRFNYRATRHAGVERDRAERNQLPERFRNPKETLSLRAKRLLRRELSKGAIRHKIIGLLLHSGASRRAFSDAWVFMDRNNQASDNAEALYKYVAKSHPEINSWFVINRDTADWRRLRREGVRTIAYGSWRWYLLMLSTAHLISSHADQYVLSPLNKTRFGEPRWRFTFLQHGVTKDDMSRWLNPKRIDLFVTSTPAEHQSIVGDDTPYTFSSKEVVLTGFPRHDTLLAKREATPVESRNYLLVMPTWRHNLVGVATTSSTKRTRNLEFSSSNYANHYSELLSSEKLAAVARKNRCEIVFMPHPMMAPYLEEFSVPEHVRVLSYDDADVQQVLARSAVLITDYSSLAFDTAMIEVPTVYYQFDSEEFFSGSHNVRVGYFDYEAHGFGPICKSLEQVETATADLLSPTSSTRAIYADRMNKTFAFRDSNNSARVVEAIRQLDKPERADKHSRAVVAPLENTAVLSDGVAASSMV